MELENSDTNEVRQDNKPNNPDPDNTLKGNNHKPHKSISRKATAQRANRKALEKIFPIKYIENGLNGTKTYKAIRPNTPSATARVEASRILTKPNVQQALQELLQENDLSVNQTMKIHHRNLIQDEDLRVSQTAVQDVYKIAGLMNNRDSSPTVNIAMIIKQ